MAAILITRRWASLVAETRQTIVLSSHINLLVEIPENGSTLQIVSSLYNINLVPRRLILDSHTKHVTMRLPIIAAVLTLASEALGASNSTDASNSSYIDPIENFCQRLWHQC